MIRGGVYQINLGQPRGHEQGGKRYGVVVSPTDSGLSVVTVVPTSTSAQPSVVRPEVEVLGETTRLLVDQIRSIDDSYVGEMVGLLSHEDYRALMTAVARYLDIEL
ncbi:type II toxin-antitoxin system PemK/MazF family toxin [uncultured Microbacterium sp.]|uniref:type II toxin-antitoxin system PemK/MazF family toxin n=1 Tax=uncultured Microbacterium sp. TaxID=191216 RepID=UPI002623F782|nr:type II toxin-antitoxin system PemK/MazF family toxin [uncultured Microbacterium sp.]